MYDKKVYDFLRSSKAAHRQWDRQNNGSDCCFINIPVEVKSTARNNFGVGHQEEIIFVRDTSFWNTANQGLVLTDAGLYCIPDNDDSDSRFVFSWEQIKKVSYLDGCLYFHGYDGDDDVCPIHMSYFLKDTDNCEYAGSVLAGVLSGVAALVKHEDPFDTADKKADKKFEANDAAGAISYIQQLIAADDGTYKSYWYFRIGNAYARCKSVKDSEKALKALDEGLKYCDEGSPISIWLHNERRSVILYSAIDETKTPNGSLHAVADCRRESLLVSQNATDQIIDTDGRLMKDDAASDFDLMNKAYCEGFCSQQYNDRKVLLVVDNYTNLYQNSISVIKKSDIPATGITFPVGHPQSDQLYVGHPYIPTKYIPFEEYQLEFVEDKVREFCWLMQCMGATKISISANNDSGRDANVTAQNNAFGSSSYSHTSANASYNKSSGLALIEQISKAISLNQTFNPTKGPYAPNDLVWYQNEASWQRLCNQRMQGAFLHATETIESRKSCMVSGSELQTIKGEMKTLFEISGEWTKEIEYKFQQQENTTLSFDVDFAPLESLGAPDTASFQQVLMPKSLGETNYLTHSANAEATTMTGDYTREEQEYINELKECLADGEIGAGERRLLGKLAAKLGISPERAAELEAFLAAPILSDDEKEYLEEFKAAAVDGVVSEKERRLLDKLKKMYGISDERAREIEKLV